MNESNLLMSEEAPQNQSDMVSSNTKSTEVVEGGGAEPRSADLLEKYSDLLVGLIEKKVDQLLMIRSTSSSLVSREGPA